MADKITQFLSLGLINIVLVINYDIESSCDSCYCYIHYPSDNGRGRTVTSGGGGRKTNYRIFHTEEVGLPATMPMQSGSSDVICDASYPDVCIASPPPDLNCDDIPDKSFKVVPSDPHGFDSEGDGIGCEEN